MDKSELIYRIRNLLDVPGMASGKAKKNLLTQINDLSVDDLCTVSTSLRIRKAELKKISSDEKKFNHMQIANLRIKKLLPNSYE